MQSSHLSILSLLFCSHLLKLTVAEFGGFALSLFKMGNIASVCGVATTAYQAARDDGSDLLDSLKKMDAESRKTALETNIKDGDDLATPLIIAARDGNLDFVKVLLRYEANIEARGTIKMRGEIIDGCTALWVAAANGHLAVVRLLIEQNAEVDGRTSTNSTPLRAAAFDGHLDIVRCLVENKADVNARNIFRNTPLMLACYNGQIEVASYLVENGADINLEDHIGDTCFHFAVRKGDVEVVAEVLALGAEQQRNHKCLTPLLEASNDCKIEIVMYLVTRPGCTKEQRVEALELLGATIANNHHAYDIKDAFCFMRSGMKKRYEDLSCLLLKTKMEPVEAYQNRTESQTLEELSLLEGDDHGIHMEGLLIRERILGTDNTELRFPITYRGAVLADSTEYELGIALFERAMEIAMNCDVPKTTELDYLTALFAEMVQNGHNLSTKNIENVFEKLVDGNWKLTEAFKSGKLQEERKKEAQIAQQELLFDALCLLIIYRKVQVPLKMKNGYIINLLQRFLRLNPRSHSDGNTLLHLAVWHKTPVLEKPVKSAVCKHPCIDTMKLILHAGCDVNAVNNEGNTPLHLAVTFVPGPEQKETLKEMLELLLDLGADTKLVNKKGQTAIDCCETRKARRILYEKERLKHMNIDARKVRKV